VRRYLFWMHLGAGLLVSVLILYFATTGALLAYERPLLHLADERFFQSAATSTNATPIPLDALLANAMNALSAPIEMVTIHQDRNLPVEIQTENRSVFLVDPRSGTVQGPASPRLRAFFAEVTALHRWFGLSSQHHAAAIAVKGATTILLLFLLFSGAFLWVPRRWTRSSVRAGFVPRFDRQGRARNYNWHKVTGFWIGAPLTVIVVSGVIMAYPWANAQLFHLAGSPLPARDASGRNPHHANDALPNRLSEAFSQATSTQDGWQTATLRLPPSATGLAFIVDAGDGGDPEKRAQVLIDPKTLQVQRREPFTTLSRGQQWRSWVRFVHTGEAGGWWGETLAVITACGAMVLSLTGIVMFLDRARRWR
jgi:uncharacterized iron-regulated membrane protein